jgi:hypothetical protein
VNVTVRGNFAFDVGPGILNDGAGSTMSINSSTIVGNRNSDFITNLNNRGGPVTIRNTIIASGASTSSASDCEGTITSQGYNLIQNPGCTITGDKTSNKLKVDPKLSPLQNNGGPTKTHIVLSGSPAIDAANPSWPGSGGNVCPAKDQRGYTRPKDGNGDGKSRCDIGSFERQVASSTTISTGSESDLANPPDPNSEPVITDTLDPASEPPVTDLSDPSNEADGTGVPEGAQAPYHVHLPYIVAP